MLGPGHLESVYELALEEEFKLQGVPVERQARFALHYKGKLVGEGRLDFLVGGIIKRCG
jgi:GxxExxY protein